jgi:Mor family transcriptional regulator
MKTYKVIVSEYGTKHWYLNDKRHREDGPAMEYAYGGKEWYINGKCHREDGPAMECANGTKYWYINDNELTEAEFNARIKQSSCDGKVVEIDGKKYRLQEVK